MDIFQGILVQQRIEKLRSRQKSACHRILEEVVCAFIKESIINEMHHPVLEFSILGSSSWKITWKFVENFFSRSYFRQIKVHIFWEGHKILRNLHCRFDRYYIGQIYGGDFTKICGLFRIYELYFLSLVVTFWNTNLWIKTWSSNILRRPQHFAKSPL